MYHLVVTYDDEISDGFQKIISHHWNSVNDY
jgi:hypothetical protein